MNRIPTVQTTGLRAQLRALGFTAGAPAHVPANYAAADRRIYRVMRCSCGGRGHKVEPLHRGLAYALLLTCRRCGAESEA